MGGREGEREGGMVRGRERGKSKSGWHVISIHSYKVRGC